MNKSKASGAVRGLAALAAFAAIAGCTPRAVTPTPAPTDGDALVIVAAQGQNQMTLGARKGEVLYDATTVLRNTSSAPTSIDLVMMADVADPLVSIVDVSVMEASDAQYASAVGFFRQTPWSLSKGLHPVPLNQASILPNKTYVLAVAVRLDKDGVWVASYDVTYTNQGIRRSAAIPGSTGRGVKVCINPQQSFSC